MIKFALTVLSLVTGLIIYSQTSVKYTLIKPARVFDGENMHNDWIVVVKNDSILAAGNMRFKLPEGSTVIELPNCTLMPGLIEGHSHLFLHPYNETSWDEQVLHESRAERVARAVNHARLMVLAGFTSTRDLGTEGAMYDDVGLKTSIEKGLVPGPRMIVATRAIVAKGTYGPRPGNADLDLPQGAAEVGNLNELETEVRTQIGKGADLVKIYADYRYGLLDEARPTFSLQEIASAVSLAKLSGRSVVAHASTPEGMINAANAGVSTIEHGDEGTEEAFRIMKQKGVALCPTLAASHAVEQYRGWIKGTLPEPERLIKKKKKFCAGFENGCYHLHGWRCRSIHTR